MKTGLKGSLQWMRTHFQTCQYLERPEDSYWPASLWYFVIQKCDRKRKQFQDSFTDTVLQKNVSLFSPAWFPGRSSELLLQEIFLSCFLINRMGFKVVLGSTLSLGLFPLSPSSKKCVKCTLYTKTSNSDILAWLNVI